MEMRIPLNESTRSALLLHDSNNTATTEESFNSTSSNSTLMLPPPGEANQQDLHSGSSSELNNVTSRIIDSEFRDGEYVIRVELSSTDYSITSEYYASITSELIRAVYKELSRIGLLTRDFVGSSSFKAY